MQTVKTRHFVIASRSLICGWIYGHYLTMDHIRVCSRETRSEKYEMLWKNLCADPSQWWDNRSEKPNFRYPDFKHKQTGEALWLMDGRNPAWVASEVSVIAPGMSIFSWPRKLSRHNKAGQYKKTLELFQQMQIEGIPANAYTFVQVLNACAALPSLKEGKRIHRQITQSGCELNLHVSNSLVDMYAKCGSIDEAWRVFDKMPTHDVVGWNAMILGCVKCGLGLKALNLFQQMQREGVMPNSVTFVGLVNACSRIADLEKGRRVHQQIIRSGCDDTDMYVGSSLVDMYAKCGCIDDAQRLFAKMPTRDGVAWTAMILGCVNCGQAPSALQLFQQMLRERIEPDSVTFVAVLKACSKVGALEEGRRVHQQIILSGFEEADRYVGNSLVDMYAKCGSLVDAGTVFKIMPTHSVVGWNALILGYVKCGRGLEALELFQQMQGDGVEPDSITFVALINACASIAALEDGRNVHEKIIKNGCTSNVYVASSLVDMYAKCGSMDDAWTVFNNMPTRNVVSWNAMITGCVKCGQGLKALDLFQSMKREGVEPNSVTFVGLLNACASIGALEEGKHVHEQIVRIGSHSDTQVGSSLVDMYSKCGTMEEALEVFDKLPTRDRAAWTTVILGSVKCGQALLALQLFQEMQQEGIEPDSVTFVAVLNACARVAALENGRRVHEQIIGSGCESNVYVGCSLIDMYAKCGNLDDARRVLNDMPTRNVVVWNAMLMGYALHGLAKDAVALFEHMLRFGSEIDEVTFIGLLSACSHRGLVKEGLQIFESMRPVYGVCPTLGHYTCMIDILGRAGCLDDAEEMVNSMPFKPSAAAWMSLLGACRIHGNVEIGERASKRVMELEPDNASGHILLANIYAEAGRWDSKSLVQERTMSPKSHGGCEEANRSFMDRGE